MLESFPFENVATLVSLEMNLAIELLKSVASGALIVVIGVCISRKANNAVRRGLEKISGFDRTLIPIAATVTRYGILLVTLLAALGSFGIQTTSIIAVLGAAGLAIGLALQGTLSNVAAGVMLIFLRPFQTGDWVETGVIQARLRKLACSPRS